MPLRTEVYTDVAALQRVSPEWRELLHASPANSIFLTPEWILAWLTSVHPSARLRVIAVRDAAGALVGLAPFYEGKLRLLRTIGYRCLRFLGEPFGGAEYGDVIARPEHQEAAIAAIASLLRSAPVDCQVCWAPNVARWTGAADRLRALAQPASSWHLHDRPRDFSVLRLADSYEVYLASLSQNQRSMLRRRERALAGESIEVVRAESSNLEELLQALFDLHARRWQSAGQAGSFAAKPLQRRFYGHFAPIALRLDWLRLYGLRVAGRFVAVQHGYRYGRTFLQMQEGLAPEVEGAGNVLRAHVMRLCIEEGLQEYDFLGGYTDHKRRWGATLRTGCDVYLGPRTLKNDLLLRRPIWPTGRFARLNRPSPKQAWPGTPLAPGALDVAESPA